MKFTGMLRRVVGAGAALVAVGAMLMAPAAATAAPAAQDDITAAGIVNILHASSRNCLEANNIGEVGLYECNGSAQQKWSNYTTGAVGRFRNLQWDACLASDGAKVFIMKSCDTPSSGWTSTSGSPRYIKHGVESSKCLHTNSGSAGKWAYLINCSEATRWSVLPA